MTGNKTNLLQKNIIIALSYILFWVTATVVSTKGNWVDFNSTLLTFLWQLLYICLINILFYSFLAPAILFRKKTIAILLIPSIILIIAGLMGWNYVGGEIGLFPKWNKEQLQTNKLLSISIWVIFGLVYHATIYFIIRAVNLELKNQQLIIAKNKADLSFLKAQTNPHFLFNTLNNIYSLARDKSDTTPDAILRLSDILRYMLYGSESNYIAIDKEAKIIEEYIELERMRYDDSLHISFQKNIDNPGREIPPLLLLPLLENAFKHGVSESIASPFIKICLTIEKNMLTFSVENSCKPGSNAIAMKENIGLKNLKRQLELLFEDYKLETNNNETSFHINLNININSHAKF